MAKKGTTAAPPPAPDPTAVANAQAQANRITQFTPQGNLVIGKTDEGGGFVPAGAGQAALQVQPSPAQADILGKVEAGSKLLAERGAALAGNLPTGAINFEGLPSSISGIDFSKITGVPSPDDFSADATRMEETTYNRGYNLLKPELERSERRLDQELANRGLPIGSELAELTADRYGRTRAAALDELAASSVGAGRAEQSRLFGQTMAAREAQTADQLREAQLRNAARATGFTERSAERTAALNELAQMLGGQFLPPASTASFITPGQVDVAGPYATAAQRDMLAWQTQQQNQQRNYADMVGGLFGLGQAGTMGYFLGK